MSFRVSDRHFVRFLSSGFIRFCLEISFIIRVRLRVRFICRVRIRVSVCIGVSVKVRERLSFIVV